MSILDDDQVNDLRAAFPAGKREQNKLRQRAKRARDRAALAAAKAAGTGDEQAFHLKNRAALAPETLKAMEKQDEAVRDQLHWMDHGHEVPPDDIDYVSMEEGIEDLIRFVHDHGVTRLGYIYKQEGIPGDWSSREYWRDAELFRKLCDEGWQTEQFVRYGLLAALPDWVTTKFLQTKAGWTWQKAITLVGITVDARGVAAYRAPGVVSTYNFGTIATPPTEEQRALATARKYLGCISVPDKPDKAKP